MVNLPQAIRKIPGAYFGMIGVVEVVVLLEIATILYSLKIQFNSLSQVVGENS